MGVTSRKFLWAMSAAVWLSGCARTWTVQPEPTKEPIPLGATQSGSGRASACGFDCQRLRQDRQRLTQMLEQVERELLAQLRRPPSASAPDEAAKKKQWHERYASLARRRLLITVAMWQIDQSLRCLRAGGGSWCTAGEVGSATDSRVVTVTDGKDEKLKKSPPGLPSIGERLARAERQIERSSRDELGDLLGSLGGSKGKPRKGAGGFGALGLRGIGHGGGGIGRGIGAVATGAQPVYIAADKDKPMDEETASPKAASAVSSSAPPRGVLPAVRKHLPGMLACIPQQLRSEPGLHLVLKARLTSSGRFRESRLVVPTDLPTKVAACLSGRLERIRVPAPSHSMVVKLPLWLSTD